MLVRRWSIWNSHTLLAGYKMVQQFWKNSLELSNEAKHTLTTSQEFTLKYLLSSLNWSYLFINRSIYWFLCLVVVIEPLSGSQPFCNPIDRSLPGSSVHGISQARILYWVAISISRGSSQLRAQTCVSCMGRGILYYWAAWEAPSLKQADLENSSSTPTCTFDWHIRTQWVREVRQMTYLRTLRIKR